MTITKKVMVAAVFLSAAFLLGYAQSNNNQPSTSKGRLERVKTPKTHRAPSNVFIEYLYTGTGLSFLPSEVYESLDVTVTDLSTADSWSATLSDAEGYYLETGPLTPGTYSIYATTDSGVEFSGTLEI